MRGNYLVKYLLCIMFFSYRSNFSLFHRPGLSRPTTFCSTAKKLIFSCIYINRFYLIRDLIQLLLIFTLSDYRLSLSLARSLCLSFCLSLSHQSSSNILCVQRWHFLRVNPDFWIPSEFVPFLFHFVILLFQLNSTIPSLVVYPICTCIFHNFNGRTHWHS